MRVIVCWSVNSFVLVLSLAGNGHADTYWTGAAGDHNWLTPMNWEGGALPTTSDEARINLAEGEPAVVLAGETAANQMRLGYGTGTRGELIIESGGLLTL